MTPGATGGIPQQPMGGGVGKKEGARHPPTSPVVSPEGFPAFGSPWSASRAGAPTTVPGPPGGRPKAVRVLPGVLARGVRASSCSPLGGTPERSPVRLVLGAPQAGRPRRPGFFEDHGPTDGRTKRPQTTPATIAHSLPRPGRSEGPSYRRVGYFGASGASRAKRRGLGTIKAGLGTCLPAILRSCRFF